MLSAIRSKASSLPVKLLFGLLVVAFAIWGIGDIFRNRGADTTVATVGSRKIDQRALVQAINDDAERLRGMFGGTRPDPEQLKQFGIVDNALQTLVNRDLIDLEVDHLGLTVSNGAIGQAIRTNRAFLDEKGQFDPNRYKAAIANQRMTVPQFESLLRGDMVRQHLSHALVAGLTPSPELVDTLYRSRAEHRVAEVAIVPPSAVGDPGTPDDADLTTFYDKHKDAFRVPELRSFNVGQLLLDDVAASIDVPEDKLREEYQTRAAEFHTAEQRHLQQILVPDEAKAKEAEGQLAAGKDFAAVAKDVADATPDMIDLGFFSRDDLPPRLADAAFAAKQNEPTQPVQDELGWHILRTSEIKPEVTQPFDAVKDKLKTEVAREMAGDQIAKAANQVDDALAGGAAFNDVVQRFNLKVAKVENVDANGRDAAGKDVEVPQPGTDILRTAFGTDAGQTSQLNEMGDAGYYVVQVDKVTPASVKPLDAVKADAVKLWQDDKRNAAQEALAKEMTDAVNGGQKLADVAAQHKITTFTSAPLQRAQGGDAKVPAALVAKIFETDAGKAVAARGTDGYAVAQVKEIQPADPSKDTAAVQRLSQQLTPSLRDDLLQQFDQALRQRYPVSIDHDAVARAF
jgi:peptidyl-prolyl cis-trans isomerase D